MQRLLERWGLWLLLGFSALARLPGLLLGVEHYGDAPVRIELAERWLAAPHLWRGFTETYQYGPLHLTLLGLSLEVLPDRLLAPKLLSLLCALGSIALLYRLTRRLWSLEAALLAGFALALDPVHLQASTSGASETIFLALLLGSLDLFLRARDRQRGAAGPAVAPLAEAPRALALLGSGLLLGLAGLIRYDGWMLAPLFGLLLLNDLRTSAARRRDLGLALAWGAVTAAPALFWMAVNARYAGSPFAPLRYIDEDHRALAAMGTRWFGPIAYRLYCLVYWPVNVLGLSSPLVGLFSLVGAARALVRRSRGWELALIAWAPALYLTFRGAVLADFRPMSRFVLTSAALSLPFAWEALGDAGDWLWARGRALPERRAGLRRLVLAAALALVPVGPLFLFFASYHQNSTLAEWARPISPVSSVPPGVEQAARWLRSHATRDDVLVVDSVWNYLEIPLVFESRIPEARVIRHRYDNFDAKLGQTPPTLAVVLYQGNLRFLPGAEGAVEGSPRFTLRGTSFCAVQHFVYASIYRRCP